MQTAVIRKATSHLVDNASKAEIIQALHNHEEAQQHGLVQEDCTQTSSCETNFAAAEGTNKSDGTCLGLTYVLHT
jgi:hypothetical protein